jgi:hypothetical protein
MRIFSLMAVPWREKAFAAIGAAIRTGYERKQALENIPAMRPPYAFRTASRTIYELHTAQDAGLHRIVQFEIVPKRPKRLQPGAAVKVPVLQW